MPIKRPRGTNDVLPEQTAKWQVVEEKIRTICRSYGYQEIRTPLFESTELFVRGIGETTDIVEKEMYTFTDRGERSITLRPEGTAPVVRAFLENKLHTNPLPAKLYYLGPMFRYERPQAGRYRQFYQFGAEAIGSPDPAIDVEMITMPMELYRACGLGGFQVHINSIGCPKCRPAYRDILKKRFGHADQLCSTCQSRLDRNPMRILDCKVDICQHAVQDVPSMVDSLCDECSDHFETVSNYLSLLGVSCVFNPRLVRGFDYYTKTVFELRVPSLGAQDAIGGGGRYDGLVTECGGPDLPAVGYAVGLDRVMLALEQQGGSIFAVDHPAGFICHFGGNTKAQALRMAHDLRRQGIWVELDYLDRSLRAQMKAANRFAVPWVIIVGEDELERGVVRLRIMATGDETDVPCDQIQQTVKGIREERQS